MDCTMLEKIYCKCITVNDMYQCFMYRHLQKGWEDKEEGDRNRDGVKGIDKIIHWQERDGGRERGVINGGGEREGRREGERKEGRERGRKKKEKGQKKGKKRAPMTGKSVELF